MMNRSLRGKKNKNAVAQYNPPAVDTSAASGAVLDVGRGNADDPATSAGDPNWTLKGPDECVEGRGNTALNTQHAQSLLGFDNGTWPNTEDSAKSDASLEAVYHDFTETANAMGRNRGEIARDTFQQDNTLTKEKDLSNYPWPGPREYQAENEAFWKNYIASGENDARQKVEGFNKFSNDLSGRGATNTAVWPYQNPSLGDNRETDHVDEPMEAYNWHQTEQGNQFGKEKTTASSKSDLHKEVQKKSYDFNNMQGSFMKEGVNLPENTHIHECGNGHAHIVNDCCGHIVGTICSHHQTGGNKGISTPVKPTRKKNSTAEKASGDEGSGAAGSVSSSKTPASTGKTKTTKLPSRYQETNATLAELVLQEGFVVKDVYPDGNCLFAAVVDQLRVRGEFFYTTKSLREVAVNYLRENPCQEDGTPLKMFLTEHDGTWDQYLTRMSREGEWGDHFVISALANVLKRRLVILRGFNTLSRTVMEPSRSHNSHKPKSPTEPETKHDDGNELGADRQAERDDEEHGGLDDLYIGHVAETHYVSLRYYNWEERLQQCLKERKVPSFLQYGPAIGSKYGEENKMVSAFPEAHLDFLLKYIRNGNFFVSSSWPAHSSRKASSKMWDVQLIKDDFGGLELGVLFGRGLHRWNAKKSSNKAATQDENNNSPWDSLHINMYLIPCDTSVHCTDAKKVSASKKDLIAVETGCPLGYTRLSPVMTTLWVLAAKHLDDAVYLKHLSLQDTIGVEERDSKPLIAFRSSWPKCADGFLSRTRCHEWPDNNLIRSIKKNGVYVIAEASQESTHSEIEWKFSFKNAERLLCLWMDRNMKYSYYYFKAVCQFLFRDKQCQFQQKDAVCTTQLKAVFFYTCEELPIERFEEQPGVCLLYMLKKLQGHLKQRFLPDYFIQGVNLIGNTEEPVLQWHAEQLEWFQAYILEGIFLLFDRDELMKHFDLGKCLETLITDAQKFMTHQSLVLSYRECFLPLNILCIQNWVKTLMFDKAKELCDSTFQECTTYIESLDASQEILEKALDGLPLQEKWLFAFYMDLMIKSHLVEVVCRHHECVQLETVFGEVCINALAQQYQVTSDSLRVPLTIIYSESIASFAENFTNILNEQEDKGVFKAATYFFLKNNTRDLLLSIEKEEKEGNYHTGNDSTKWKLYRMFTFLYNVYDYERKWMEFFNLMDEFDLLSQHYQHAELNRQVAVLWNYYKIPEKYQGAMARYQSLAY